MKILLLPVLVCIQNEIKNAVLLTFGIGAIPMGCPYIFHNFNFVL